MPYSYVGLIVFANIMYHVSQKSIPAGVAPLASLIATYTIALVVSIIAYIAEMQAVAIPNIMNGFTWASAGVAIAVVGVEIGFLLAYRVGWNINVGALIANVAVAMLLIPIGHFMFKERLTMNSIFGMLFCLVGLYLLFKR